MCILSRNDVNYIQFRDQNLTSKVLLFLSLSLSQHDAALPRSLPC